MDAWPYPFWIAHRGAGPLAPENTLAAFKLGAAHGYRMFECDAQLSRDGVVFLLHDGTLDRTTNGHGPACAQDWQTLCRLDAGRWHSPAHAGEPLPTLQQLARLTLAAGHFLNIEIKPAAGDGHPSGQAIAREAARCWHGRTPPLLTSFEPDALAGARDAAPQLPRGLLFEALPSGWLDTAQTLGCVAVVCHHPLWDAARVSEAHQAGMRCLSYTVNDALEARRLMALGIDGIVTDRVDLFRPV